mmetsp:Transcript_11427/g.47851  ORF Transcript_11427/g.47851 Transcript_11427/m.47851 type:complete len:201 (-) Transcript_11427:1599-2201(-)
MDPGRRLAVGVDRRRRGHAMRTGIRQERAGDSRRCPRRRVEGGEDRAANRSRRVRRRTRRGVRFRTNRPKRVRLQLDAHTEGQAAVRRVQPTRQLRLERGDRRRRTDDGDLRAEGVVGVGLPGAHRVRRVAQARVRRRGARVHAGPGLTHRAQRVLVFAQGDDRAGRSGRAQSRRVDRCGVERRDVRRGRRYSRGYPRGD